MTQDHVQGLVLSQSVLDRLEKYPAEIQKKLGTEFDYLKAFVYHRLGMVAQAQHQRAAAEQSYQKALAIFIEFNDRYSQSHAYNMVVMVAEEQEQWQSAKDYFLKALKLWKEFSE